MNRRACNWAVVGAAFLLLVVNAPAADQQTRTWTDKGGKFTIEAKFVELHDGTVGLLRTDGKRIDVPLEKLSEADVKYVRSLEKEQSPFSDTATMKPSVASASASDTTVGTSTQGLPAGTFESAKQLNTNLKPAKLVRPLTFTKWTFKPTSNMPTAELKEPPNSIPLGPIPNSQAFFETINGLYVSPDLKQAIVARQQGLVGEGKNYLERVDLVEGRCDELVPIPPNTKLLAVWPVDGQLLLGLDATSVTNSTRLAFAKLDHNEIVPVATWKPYVTEEWEPNRRVDHTSYLSADRILTLNDLGHAMTIWNVQTAAAQIAIPLKSGVLFRWTISPDRKYLAVGTDDIIPIIDLETGTHVATINTEKLDMEAKFAFSDDNHVLAMIAKDCLTVWDLTTGNLLRQFNHQRLLHAGTMHWMGDYLLVDGRSLFDVRHEVLLWEYAEAPTELLAYSGGGRIWSASSFHGQSLAQLLTAKLPDERALEIAKKLPSTDDLQIMKPGDAVQVKTDINPELGSENEIRAAIIANLTDAGFKVADEADLVLTATCKRQKSQTDKFAPARRPGRPGFFAPPDPSQIMERTYTPCESSITIAYKGRSIWWRNKLAAPGSYIQLAEGETLDQYLDKVTKPDLDLLKTTKFGGHFTQPGTATPTGAYGTSTLPVTVPAAF